MMSVERTVFKHIPESREREFEAVVTKLGDGGPVRTVEKRTRKETVFKPFSETRTMKYGKEGFRIIQGGEVVDLTEHSDLFKEPTPALLVEQKGKMLEQFDAQFLSKEA